MHLSIFLRDRMWVFLKMYRKVFRGVEQWCGSAPWKLSLMMRRYWKNGSHSPSNASIGRTLRRYVSIGTWARLRRNGSGWCDGLHSRRRWRCRKLSRTDGNTIFGRYWRTSHWVLVDGNVGISSSIRCRLQGLDNPSQPNGTQIIRCSSISNGLQSCRRRHYQSCKEWVAIFIVHLLITSFTGNTLKPWPFHRNATRAPFTPGDFQRPEATWWSYSGSLKRFAWAEIGYS